LPTLSGKIASKAFDGICDKARFNACCGQYSVHALKRGTKFLVIFRAKNDRKFWTKFGLKS